MSIRLKGRRPSAWTTDVLQVYMPAVDGPRIRWLDSLRGVAALTVVLGHYFSAMLPRKVQDAFDPGVFGVAVFFLISGYIVPMTVRPSREHIVLRFVWSRIFRLYPLYWVSLVFGAVAYGSGMGQIMANATMAQRYIGVQDVINVYWTLQIELVFYCILVLTMLSGIFNQPRVVTGFALLFAVCAVIFGAVRCFLDVKAPIALPLGMTVLFIGNLKSLNDLGAIPRQQFWIIVLSLSSCILLACCLGYNRDWGFRENPGRSIISYFVAGLLFFAAARFRPSWVLPASLGAISYSIYLFHQPIVVLAQDRFNDVGPVLIRVAALIAVLILAIALHFAVEKPSIRLGRRLLAGLQAFLAETTARRYRRSVRERGL